MKLHTVEEHSVYHLNQANYQTNKINLKMYECMCDNIFYNMSNIQPKIMRRTKKQKYAKYSGKKHSKRTCLGCYQILNLAKPSKQLFIVNI